MIFKYLDIIYSYTRLLYNLRYYINSKKEDNLLVKNLVENIKRCGAIAIKLSQWSIPRLELLGGNVWLKSCEELYDDCNWHSLDYTRKIYKDRFNKDLEEDYSIEDQLGSGSIGQVYKIKNKKTGDYDILKVRHPNIENELWLFKIIYKILNIFIFEKLRYYLPFDIKLFIVDFEKQINFVNEANNIIYFSDKYRDNKYVIIPEIKLVSENILIMSYEESEKIDNNLLSEYNKYKLLNLLFLFIRNNEIILNYNHGDLHKGNWGIRDDKIVIYDFGYCYSANDEECAIVKLISKTFDSENILELSTLQENLIMITKFLIQGDIDKILEEKIKKLVRDNFLSNNTFDLSVNDGIGSPNYILEIIIKFSRENKRIISSKILNYFILFIQCKKYYDICDATCSGRSSEILYKKRYIDIITLCNTYNIYNEYVKYIVDELNNHNLEKSDIFDTIDYGDTMNNELIELMKKDI